MSVRVGPLSQLFPQDSLGRTEVACYLDADLPGELHSFAGRAKISFARFEQRAKLPAMGRYLLNARQREEAIRLGAIEVAE